MSGSVNNQFRGASDTSGDRRDVQRFSLSVLNSLQSQFVVCLLLTSLFCIIGAAMAQRISVIFGIIGLWLVLLDWAPETGLLRRVGRTVIVAAKGNHEIEADRVPVLLRLGGAVLVLWALAAGVLPQQSGPAPQVGSADKAISR